MLDSAVGSELSETGLAEATGVEVGAPDATGCFTALRKGAFDGFFAMLRVGEADKPVSFFDRIS